MKLHRALLVFLGLVVAAVAHAQPVPAQLSFTGNLTGSGGPVTGTHSFVFTLFDGATGGTATWTETQGSVQVNNGLVFASLGAVTPLDPTVLNGAPLYLEVAVDGTTLSPRVAILSVPYAIRAGWARTAETIGPLLAGEVQKRVNGQCVGASAVQSIDADGGVTCVSVGGASIVSPANGGTGITGPTAAGQYLRSTGAGVWAAQTIASGDLPAVTQLQGRAVANTAPGANQALVWSGSAWAPAAVGSVTSVGVGAGLSGGPITTTGTLSVNFGNTAGTAAAGNDPRLPPAPGVAGRLLYDNGTAWVPLPNGAAGTILAGGATPAWSPTTNITSVGTLGSLNVTGSVTAGNFVYAAPRTRTVTVHAVGFATTSSAVVWGMTFYNSKFISGPAATYHDLAAPVSLPQGAVVTQIACRMLYNYGGALATKPTIGVVQGTNNTWACSPTVPTATSAGFQIVTSSCGFTVDNVNTAHYMRYYVDPACNASCALESCTLTYTTSAP